MHRIIRNSFLLLLLFVPSQLFAAGAYLIAPCNQSFPMVPADTYCWDAVTHHFKYFSGALNAWVLTAAGSWTGTAPSLSNAATTNFLVALGNAAVNVTEAIQQQPISKNATLTNLYCQVSVAQGAAKSDTFTLRKNGLDTTLTCTMINIRTCKDINPMHAVDVVAGDLLDIKDVTIGSSIPNRAGGCSFLN